MTPRSGPFPCAGSGFGDRLIQREPSSRHRTGALLLWAIAIAAFALRLAHLRWGLPEIYEEATPVREAIGLWGKPGQGIDLNPHFFKYPSFSFYLHFIVQSAIYLWLSLIGKVGSLADFRQLLAQELGQAVMWGRMLSAAIGASVVFPTFVLGRRLGGRTVGFVAALLSAVLPLAVLESQLVSPDIVLLVATMWGLAYATRYAETGRRGDAIVTGIWLGLATAAKYPGAFVLVALLAAHWVAVRRKGEGPGSFLLSSHLFQSLFAAVVAFAIASPYVLIDARTAWTDISFERRHMVFGHLGREGGRAWGFYLLHVLPQGLSIPVAILAVLGIVLLLRDRRRRGEAMAGLAFSLIFLGVLGSWKMAAPRYVLPLVPLAAVWAAVGMYGLVIAVPTRDPRTSRALLTFLSVLLVAIPAVLAVRAVNARGAADSRTAASDWILQHVPAGASLLVERYGPEPDPNRYSVVYLPFHGVTPHVYDAAYIPALYGTFQYFVISSGVSARYLADIRQYPVQAAFYREMEKSFEEVARFGPSRETGPEIRILKRREDAQPAMLTQLPELFFSQQKGNSPLAEYFSALGTALVKQGNKEFGFRLLTESVDMDPKSAVVWGNMGAMRLKNGQLEDALVAFRRAHEIAPTDSEILYNMGVLYDRMGEARQSAETLTEAIGRDPSLEGAYLVLARALVEDDRYEAARAVLRQFLDRFPRSADRKRAEEALTSLDGMGHGRP
jgi:dolichyl-phosphate-mannose-protein mannosyltransferase/tetratricopeptide repeat protein